MGKERADKLLVARELAPTREKAQALILAGAVWSGDRRVDKPGQLLLLSAGLEVRQTGLPFVSRGGLKLERALECFALDVRGVRALDVGASTGGFTDCLLQRGAAHVVAVDVGAGQLDYKLRQDPRVTCLEKVNARYLSSEQVSEPVDFVSVDVSFISLELVLGPLVRLLRPGGTLVCLIKPQFEAGREQVRKGGVVRDPAVHRQVVRRVLEHALALGLEPVGLTWSPLRGPAGNLEFLAGFRRGGAKDGAQFLDWIEALVEGAHQHVPRGP